MSKHFRYPSVVFKDNHYFILVGNKHFHTGVTKVFKVSIEDFESKLDLKKLSEVQTINYTKHFTHHNLTTFKNKNEDKYLAIGGMFRNQKPFKDNKREDGLTLYESPNLINWKYKSLILTKKNFPQKFTISIEKSLPEFDSNLCVFYSKMFKKYILIGRANVDRGVRSMQYTSTKDFKKWANFKLFNIDTFSPGNNYYMFKCIEIEKKGFFLGLGVYTNKSSNPTRIQIKKLISKDMTSWTDCGKLCDCTGVLYIDPKSKDKKSSVHVAGILLNGLFLEIFLHLNCFDPESFIKKYKLKFNPKEDFMSEVKKLKIVI